MIGPAAVLRGAVMLALTLGAGGWTGSTAPQTPSTEEWRTFNGTWSARGERQSLPVEGGGTAAIVHLSGSVVLVNGADLGGGLLGEAIAFDDGRNVSAGRAVWTDSRGDRVFSELTGGPVATGRRIVGTFTGGTGRFAGISGGYELTWQYVASEDENVVQGRATDLHGRFRRGTAG